MSAFQHTNLFFLPNATPPPHSRTAQAHKKRPRPSLVGAFGVKISEIMKKLSFQQLHLDTEFPYMVLHHGTPHRVLVVVYDVWIALVGDVSELAFHVGAEAALCLRLHDNPEPGLLLEAVQDASSLPLQCLHPFLSRLLSRLALSFGGQCPQKVLPLLQTARRFLESFRKNPFRWHRAVCHFCGESLLCHLLVCAGQHLSRFGESVFSCQTVYVALADAEMGGEVGVLQLREIVCQPLQPLRGDAVLLSPRFRSVSNMEGSACVPQAVQPAYRVASSAVSVVALFHKLLQI